MENTKDNVKNLIGELIYNKREVAKQYESAGKMESANYYFAQANGLRIAYDLLNDEYFYKSLKKIIDSKTAD